jgi:hypothetical protein
MVPATFVETNHPETIKDSVVRFSDKKVVISPNSKTMYKKIIVTLLALCPLFAFGQNERFSHQTEVYLGYANRSGMDGLSLQWQYALGINRHLDLLASVSFIHTTDFNHKIDKEGTFMTTNELVSLGVRGVFRLGNSFDIKLSGMAGTGMDFAAYNNTFFGSYRGKWNCMLDGKAQFDYQLASKCSIGVFYEYCHFFGAQNIQMAGISAGFLL